MSMESDKSAELLRLQGQIERDSQKQLSMDATRNVVRATSSMKAVSFTLNESIYADLQDIAAGHGVNVTQILRGAAISYVLGELKLDRGKLVTTADTVRDTSLFTSSSVKAVGRPRKEEAVPVTTVPKKKFQDPKHDEKGKFLPPHEWDHDNLDPYDYIIPKEPHIHVDPRKHLTMSTVGDVTKNTFEDFCSRYYARTAIKFDPEVWRGYEVFDFFGYCATKFLVMNGIDNLRYEPPTVQADIYRLIEEWQMWVDAALDYKKETGLDPK